MNHKPKGLSGTTKIPAQLAIEHRNVGALAIAAGVEGQVQEIVINLGYKLGKEHHTKTPEELKIEMIHRLESLDKKLEKGIAKYKELFGEDFLYIEDASINIGYGEYNCSIKPNPKNIQVLSIFPIVYTYDKTYQLDFFRKLLSGLKRMNPENQAHIFGFIDLFNLHVISMRYNVPKLEGDNKEFVEGKLQELQKLYELMLKNIFDLFSDYHSKRTICLSNKIHTEIASGELYGEAIYKLLVRLYGHPIFR